MRRVLLLAAALWSMTAGLAWSQVKTSRDRVLFYTSEWKGDRFPDGRPKVPDDLLTRART